MLPPYATVEKLEAGFIGTDHGLTDEALLRFLLAASRSVDRYCSRHFYVEEATRYFTSLDPLRARVDDLLQITAFVEDTDGDYDYEDQTWSASDYHVDPSDGFPWRLIWVSPYVGKVFYGVANGLKITGSFGGGNWQDQDPTEVLSGVTVTVADASTETVTVSTEGVVEVGQALKVGSERMIVTAATSDGSNEITAKRAQLGTTGAAHATLAASAYLFPDDVAEAVLDTAAQLYQRRSVRGLGSRTLGDDNRAFLDGGLTMTAKELLATFRKYVA